MVATSSVPAVQDKLVDLLVAARPDVQVWDGPPVTAEDAIICVGWTPNGPAVTGTQVRATIGQDGRRDEDYELVVHCSAVTSGDEPADRRAVRDLTYGLMATVEATLTSDPTVGGLVNLLAEVVSYDAFEGYLEDEEGTAYPTDKAGRYVAVDVRVRVQNQLI
jgi:hypothetical protein